MHASYRSQKTYIYAPGRIWTHNLRRRGALDPLSTYLCIRTIENNYWRELLGVRVWWVCLGPRVGLLSPCFRVGVVEWHTVGKYAALISAFETSS